MAEAQGYLSGRLGREIERLWKELQDAHGELTDDHKKAFAHVYGAAATTNTFGADQARRLGQAREQRSWPQFQGQSHNRRDTYADTFNNEIGIAIARGSDPRDAARLAYQAVRDGTAIVNIGFKDFYSNGRLVQATDYDRRVPKGASAEMSLQQIDQHAKQSATGEIQRRNMPVKRPLIVRRYDMLE